MHGLSGCLPTRGCRTVALSLQGDKQLREAMDVILECAFGSIPYTDSTCVPSSSTCVDVALRESAYNPLHPQHQLQQQDETLYVAFQQHIQIKVSLDCSWLGALLHVDIQVGHSCGSWLGNNSLHLEQHNDSLHQQHQQQWHQQGQDVGICPPPSAQSLASAVQGTTELQHRLRLFAWS